MVERYTRRTCFCSNSTLCTIRHTHSSYGVENRQVSSSISKVLLEWQHQLKLPITNNPPLVPACCALTLIVRNTLYCTVPLASNLELSLAHRK